MGAKPEPGEITRLLEAVRQGNAEAGEDLFGELYRELHRLAVQKMAQESPGQTLQPTALVHEAWLRLLKDTQFKCPDRAYFFAAAGEAMRRILVEHARRKKRLKRGGNLQRVDIEGIDLPSPLPDEDLLLLDEALSEFARSEPRGAELVKLLMFVGLTQEEAAKELGVSLATVERDWAYAKGWLYREIQRIRNESGAPRRN